MAISGWNKYMMSQSEFTADHHGHATVLMGTAPVAELIQLARGFLLVNRTEAQFIFRTSGPWLAVRMERHNTTAMTVAQWLSTDPRVKTVFYPGLPQHPDHAIARGQMRGFGGLISFDVGSLDTARAVLPRFRARRSGVIVNVRRSTWLLSIEATPITLRPTPGAPAE